MTKLSRRGLLGSLLLGGAGTGLMVGGAAAGGSPTAAPSAQAQGSCVLFPEAVEGPYYFDPNEIRRDLTEGRPGHPMRLMLKVIEHATCRPIASARVDVWHADALGIYSGYPAQGDDRSVSAEGQTYLRGTQFSDADGNVSFDTIYPGWYPGRTPHIHLKVFLDQKTLVTSQAYLPDDLSARIYREHQPYTERPVADTTNDQDYFFRSGVKQGGGIVMALEDAPERLTASLLLAVDRSGKSRAGFWFWR
ncbi:MAG: intradiol ring-cleavage dioxygenase [Alphaproteobacteria bacterium]|nr:intradiol ring-cleavage dioxygenase [Alphaproteobacteria bacterium]